jgi:hypothetical protein
VTAAQADPTEIRRALELLIPKGGVFEIRALEVRRGRGGYTVPVCSGYFDSIDAAVKAAVELSDDSGRVYFTINPVNPDLLARANNRVVDIKSKDQKTTSDGLVTRRAWMYLDLDAVYPHMMKIPATEEEHEAALALGRDVVAWLSSRGWPAPIVADSGNGGALFYSIDLPNTPESLALIERVLKMLDQKFSTDEVEVDTSVGNAARIVRLPGTVNRKNDGAEKRPHRTACLLSGEVPEVVSEEMLHEVAAELVEAKPAPRPTAVKSGSADWLGDFVARHIPDAVGPKPWGRGPRIWTIPVCPWNSDHSGNEAWVGELADGKFGAGCQHASCSHQNWQSLKAHYEPTKMPSGLPATAEAAQWVGYTAQKAGKAETIKVDAELQEAYSTGVTFAMNGGKVSKPASICDTDARRFRHDIDGPKPPPEGGEKRDVNLGFCITHVQRYVAGTRATFKIDIEADDGKTHTLRHLDGSMIGTYAKVRDLIIEACIVPPAPTKKTKDKWDEILAAALALAEDGSVDAETNVTTALSQGIAGILSDSEMGESEADLKRGMVWRDEHGDTYAYPRSLMAKIRAHMADDKPSREQVVDATKILGCETRRPTLPDGKRPRCWMFPAPQLQEHES